MIYQLWLANGTERAFGFKRVPKGYEGATASKLLWLPKSQVQIIETIQKPLGWTECLVKIPSWLAQKHGLKEYDPRIPHFLPIGPEPQFSRAQYKALKQ